MSNSSVIRQKDESQNGCFKIQKKHVKFSEKKPFLTPLIRSRTCAYQGVRNVCFSENLAGSVFLKHPFWDSPFCLITNELVAQGLDQSKKTFLSVLLLFTSELS